MKKNLLEAIVVSSLLQGCAYGSIDDVEEELSGRIVKRPDCVTEPNCLPPAMEKCRYLAQANMVMDLEVTPFEIDNFKAEFTAFNFSLETETFMLSYATTKKGNKSGIVKASPGSVIELPDRSTVYVGTVYFGTDFKTSWAFLYYVSNDVPTHEVNLLASGDRKTISEEFAFTSSCITRNYGVEVFRTGESMPNGYVGPGTVLSWGNEKAILHEQPRYADGFGLWSYGYGMDAFLNHRFNAGEDFTHSILYFFEDAYNCE